MTKFAVTNHPLYDKFIVPIDFSETSKNAARYAAHISTLVPDSHLILWPMFLIPSNMVRTAAWATDKKRMPEEATPSWNWPWKA